MKKAKSAGRDLEIAPFNKRKVNVERIKLDFTTKDLKKFFGPAIDLGNIPIFSWPIETLSPTKTIGKGRTNITLVESDLVQVDATTPHASFDFAASPANRKPAAQMHFRPSAYGLTSASSYLMTFKIETVGPCTFQLGGNFGFLSNGGSRTVNGLTSITLEFTNVPANLDMFGFIQQTSGGRWIWFSVETRHPALVLQP